MDFSNLRSLKNLERLNMALTGKHTMETMNVIASLHSLKWLNLHGCKHLQEEHLKVCHIFQVSYNFLAPGEVNPALVLRLDIQHGSFVD